MNKSSFSNKVVLVTGSSSGIGKAVALRFAQEGANLIVNSRNNVQGGQEVLDEIKRLGTKAIYVQADITSENQVDVLFDAAMTEFGRVDILVNNAGSALGRSFYETDKIYWLKEIENNLIGSVLCSQKAAKIMQTQKKGAIINTSSVRGLEHTGREGIMAYSASKAALINFTKTLAKQLAPDISVNAVVPGFVHVPGYDSMPKELIDVFISNTLIGRFITPEELSEAFVFLASSPAITGQNLIIDGGFSLKFNT